MARAVSGDAPEWVELADVSAAETIFGALGGKLNFRERDWMWQREILRWWICSSLTWWENKLWHLLERLRFPALIYHKKVYSVMQFKIRWPALKGSDTLRRSAMPKKRKAASKRKSIRERCKLFSLVYQQMVGPVEGEKRCKKEENELIRSQG